MTIAGIEKCSLVDWPGMIAAVLFTPGCNLDCYYCQNRALLGKASRGRSLDHDELFAFLDRRRGLLDGVVLSGGEPTLQEGIAGLLRDIRRMGFKVKLDTNGARPDVLAGLLAGGLLDYVAMDVKAPWSRYAEIGGAPVDVAALQESAAMLLAGRVDYEFRTTAAPMLSEDDVVEIAGGVRGARRYVLQQYRRPAHEVYRKDPRLEAPPHPADWFQRVLARLDGFFDRCETRGVDLPSQAVA